MSGMFTSADPSIVSAQPGMSLCYGYEPYVQWCFSFNEISQSDTGSVTTMRSMFNVLIFQWRPSNWDIGSVTTMNFMFQDAQSFDGDISVDIGSLKRCL